MTKRASARVMENRKEVDEVDEQREIDHKELLIDSHQQLRIKMTGSSSRHV